MKSKLRYYLKAFLSLHKGEQIGIVLLLLISLIFYIASHNISLFKKEKANNYSNYEKQIELFESRLNEYNDSILLRKKQSSGTLSPEEAKQLIKGKYFDPNYATQATWLEMGFSLKQYKTIKKYLDKGGRFYVAEDLRKIYNVSDNEFVAIQSFIKIETKQLPPNTKRATVTAYKKPKELTTENAVKKAKLVCEEIEINSATAKDFEQKLNLKSYLAERIIKYRKLLGGFYSSAQLKKVYGLNDSIFNDIEKCLTCDVSKIKCLNINNIEFKELLKHPEFDFDLVKQIFDARNKESAYFKDYNDFILKTQIDSSKVSCIKHYLYFGLPK